MSKPSACRSTLRTVLTTGALATTALVATAWQATPAAAAPATPAVEPAAVPAPIDARLHVAPYLERLRADGGLVLDGMRLRVLDGIDAMDSNGSTLADDRIRIDVHDALRSFSPAMVRLVDAKAIELANELDEAVGGPLAAAFERANSARGMLVMLGTQPYARNGFGAIDLPNDVTLVVQEAYHGLDDDNRPFIDDRVVLAIADDTKGCWPLVLRLDREIAKALSTELRDAVKRRAMQDVARRDASDGAACR
ncbi:MAG: hypothetical protein U0575_03715 [Phycisphaerales bacterium]|jgi:hypothetical protein